MTTFFWGSSRAYGLITVAFACAMPCDHAFGRTPTMVELPGNPSSDFTANGDNPRTDRWILHSEAQLAAVAAGGGEAGIFLGIQCDPFDPIARRMIIGVQQGANAPELRSLLHSAAPKIQISTRGQTVRSAFDASPEDRGRTNYAGSADYIAAYLSPAQLDAIASANVLAVKVGQKTYMFTGYGSNLALDSMTCKSKRVHIASRLIESNRKREARTPASAWRVSYHSGAAALIKGSIEASVSATTRYLDEGTTYRLGVVCHGRKLYARVEAGFSPSFRDDENFEKSAIYIAKYSGSHKRLEVYKEGERTTTIGISQQDMAGLGHQLSGSEIASLMEADDLVVSSANSTVNFPAAGSSEALGKTFQTCGLGSTEKRGA